MEKHALPEQVSLDFRQAGGVAGRAPAVPDGFDLPAGDGDGFVTRELERRGGSPLNVNFGP